MGDEEGKTSSAGRSWRLRSNQADKAFTVLLHSILPSKPIIHCLQPNTVYDDDGYKGDGLWSNFCILSSDVFLIVRFHFDLVTAACA